MQDLVSRVGAKPHWQARRIPEPKEAFEKIAGDEARGLTAARALSDHLAEKVSDWPTSDVERLAPAWRKDAVKLAGQWEQFNEEERFAVLRRTASTLRTGLTNDVESRRR